MREVVGDNDLYMRPPLAAEPTLPLLPRSRRVIEDEPQSFVGGWSGDYCHHASFTGIKMVSSNRKLTLIVEPFIRSIAKRFD
jgi:hypothetical protein